MNNIENNRRQGDKILEEVKEKVDRIYILLNGDGSNNNPGMLIRLDRLEQLQQKRSWHLKLIYGGVITVLIERAFHYVNLAKLTSGHG